jgi:hypothetical protein
MPAVVAIGFFPDSVLVLARYKRMPYSPGDYKAIMSVPMAPNKANIPTKAPETSWKCETAEEEEPVGVETAAVDELPPAAAVLEDGKLAEALPAELPLPVALAEVVAGEPPPPPFLDAHAQTATAAEDAWMPVTAPQAETTQFSASELMAEAADDEHWQA